MYLWPAKTRKYLSFLRSIHVLDLLLKYCSDLIERIGIYLLFHCILLVHFFALFARLSFFICKSGSWAEVVSYCSVTDTFAIGFQNQFYHDWVGLRTFLLEHSSVRRLHTWLEWNLDKSLKCLLFLTTSNLFDSLWGILFSSLNVPVPFSHIIVSIDEL